MVQARVKWFDMEKGYGFVQTDQHEEDIFIHATVVRDFGIGIRQGDRLEVELEGRQSRTRGRGLMVKKINRLI